MTELDTSEALHRRVRAFARASLKPETPAELGSRAKPETLELASDSFEQLALDIARFQLEARRARTGVALALPERFSEIVPVVVDAFRCSDVFAFPTERARVCFRTSGTTGAASGRHYMRTTETYEEVALEWGRRALLPEQLERRPRVLCLMPEPGDAPSSSLGFMAQKFLQRFDVEAEPEGNAPRDLAERWCSSASGLDMKCLGEQIARAHERAQPVLLLATSFALVMLLDELGERELRLPPGSVVMQTGGFKGRTREVPAHTLAAGLACALQPQAIVGEYGMTELSSQLYEGVLPGAALRGPPGIYLPPPWLRVIALDPGSLEPVTAGEVGLAAFVDLANVDSALVVLTQDLVRLEAGGVRLLGRFPRAPIRGCSLAFEALGAKQISRAKQPPAEQISRAEQPPAEQISRAEQPPAEQISRAEQPPAEQINTAERTSRAEQPPAEQINTAEQPPAEPINRAARARIERLIDAARRLRDPNDPLGSALRRDLVHTTGLSPEAVALGLEHSLETAPAEAELDALCRSFPAAPRVWVVPPANVFVAAHRAIACALGASERVIVRPSRREPALVRALHAATRDLFELSSELEPTLGDHVHAYGSDETADELAARLPEGVELFTHGSGFGAGLVLDPAQIESSAEGFALDAVLFEQRGCLSPKLIGVGPNCDAAAFSDALLHALEAWAHRVPPPAIAPGDRAELAWHANLGAAIGDWRRVNPTSPDASCGSVLLVREPHALPLPPSGRNLVVFVSADPVARLRELEPLLTCIGVAGTARRHELHALFPGARLCAPGTMQRPPFDGPVDRRC